MKKLLLLVILMSFLTVNAQHIKKELMPVSRHSATLNSADKGAIAENNVMPGLIAPQTFIPLKEQRDIKNVNPIPIGESGNAFGFAFMRTTYLWADNNINSVAFMHRMGVAPGTGYLAYDFSRDGGLAGTWTNNVQTYNSTLPDAFNARYPQGAIYNPPGNIDPDNAYYHYFAPTLDGSNTSGTLTWGGYAYGVKNLAEGSVPTQHNRPSVPPFYQFLPSGFTITQTGEAWMVDANSLGDGAGGYDYQGDLIVGRGIWDEDLSDYNYNFDLFPLEVNADGGLNDIKIAFAPDGLTGYICAMTELPDVLPYTSYHPVLFKTTDGGETWSDPIEVQLGGEYGLEPVQQYIADSTLEWFFDPNPVPPRDEIPYWMGYECDLSVDAWGNPHIIGLVAISDAEGIYTNEGLIAMFHVWSDDQGSTWRAFNLSDIKRFKADFGVAPNAITMYNRPQVSTTMDGVIVFFSWIDTEDPNVVDNMQPDIFFREYLPTLDTHGDAPENVTTFSAAMWAAYYGCMSHYVFSAVSVKGHAYSCTIPFVYEEMDGNDPLLPVQFYYIPDFVKTYVIDFDGIGDKEESSARVSQNYPNPFNGATTITVNLQNAANLSMKVSNILGQEVMDDQRGYVAAGNYYFQVDGSKLQDGVYFYTVKSNNHEVTKKMIVR